jgi:hypothetical protein
MHYKMELELQYNHPLAEPGFIQVQGGDKLEVYVKEGEGFFLDGKYQANALPPYSDKVFLVLVSPSGKNFRLADKASRLQIERGGKLWIDVGVAQGKTNDYNIYTGKNLQAKRLSEFSQKPITISFRRVTNFDGAMMVAKELDKDIKTEFLARHLDRIGRSTGKLIEELEPYVPHKWNDAAEYNEYTNQKITELKQNEQELIDNLPDKFAEWKKILLRPE